MAWVKAWIGFWIISAAIGLMGANLMAMDLAINPQPRLMSAAGLGAFCALVLVSVGSLVAWLVRWWRERNLDDVEEPHQDEDEADDEQAELLTAS